MKIVWSPLALVHVEDTARYIAEDSPDAAVAGWRTCSLR
jgi:plasmid stabilization system protein ParE